MPVGAVLIMPAGARVCIRQSDWFSRFQKIQSGHTASISFSLPFGVSDEMYFGGYWPGDACSLPVCLPVCLSVCLSVDSIFCRKRRSILTKLGSFYWSITRLCTFQFGHPTCQGCHIISQTLPKSAKITLSAVTRKIMQIKNPDRVHDNLELSLHWELPFSFRYLW